MFKSRLAILASALFVVTCGGGPAATSAPTATAAATSTAAETVEQRMARLYEAAKAEGVVNLYSSLNTADAKIVLPVFEKQFPGIKVEHTRASGEQLVQKLVTEKKAGQDLFDVVETNNFEVKFVIDQGYTQKYAVASWEDYPANARDDKGQMWIADRVNKNVPSFNTQKIGAGNVLKTWKDMCDKKYEGKIAVESGDVAVYTMLRLALGEAQAQDIVKCVAANKPRLTSGHTDTDNLLAAGEFAISFNSYASVIANLKNDKKSPVDFVRTEPVLVDIQLMALANKPPHPNAAKLLMEWLAAPDGQQAIANAGRETATTNAKVKQKYPELALWGKAFYNSPDNQKDFERDAAFWRSTLGIK